MNSIWSEAVTRLDRVELETIGVDIYQKLISWIYATIVLQIRRESLRRHFLNYRFLCHVRMVSYLSINFTTYVWANFVSIPRSSVSSVYGESGLINTKSASSPTLIRPLYLSQIVSNVCSNNFSNLAHTTF